MQEFRITVRTNYEPGCPGFDNPKARQGHYFRGENLAAVMVDAWKQIKANQPWVKDAGALDVQYWGDHPKRGQLIN